MHPCFIGGKQIDFNETRSFYKQYGSEYQKRSPAFDTLNLLI